MDVQSIRERVESALRRVKPAGTNEDVVSLGLVGDVQVDEAGAVSVLLGLRPAEVEQLVSDFCVSIGQNGCGKQTGIGCTGLANGKGSDGYACWHLDNR